jgi:hypothetical protein
LQPRFAVSTTARLAVPAMSWLVEAAGIDPVKVARELSKETLADKHPSAL